MSLWCLRIFILERDFCRGPFWKPFLCVCKPEKPLCTPTLRRYRGIPHNTHAERERGEYYAFNTKPSKSRTNNTALRCTSSDDKPPPSRSNKTTPRFQSFETTTMKKKTVDEFWGTLRVFVPPSRRAVCRDVCPSRSRVGFSETQRLR